VGRDDPYHHLAAPIFSDSLSDGQSDNLWYVGKFYTNAQSIDCKFDNGHYLITSQTNHFIGYCNATSTDYNDFVYEVQMKIVEGDCAGIVFRADAEHIKDYTFDICWNGVYHLYRYDRSTKPDTLQAGTDRQIKNNSIINRLITLAVVARGIDFELYLDHILVNTAFDNSGNALKQGAIGVEAHDEFSVETQVEFNNARVWTF
jgi:hypothetical protein